MRELVLRIAAETGWGYTRILGEMQKLGVHSVGRTTVRNILIEAGYGPGPARGEGTWDEFLRIHAKTLWASDFLGKKVWTLGVVDYYLLFFIHLKTRRVIVSAATVHPTDDWVTQQGRNFLMQIEDAGDHVTDLIHDWDTKYTQRFDALLKSEDVRVHRVGPAKPNLNAHAERFVQTLKQECLDHFVVLGDKHLNHLVHEFVDYYHECRPHQGIGNVPPTAAGLPPPSVGEIACDERLGGLLKHYYRKAA